MKHGFIYLNPVCRQEYRKTVFLFYHDTFHELEASMAVEHYENFPVASILLPSRLKRPVEVIYAFARSADDMADEGDFLPEERLAALAGYMAELDTIERDEQPASRLFIDLKQVIHEFSLPLEPFRNLLAAFIQDISTKRYDRYENLLDYCRLSANPVGLLMLHLYEAATEENIRMSDAICTSLQLINFWQDVAIDWKKNRIYLPQEDMEHFGVTSADIAGGHLSAGWRSLMQFEVERTRKLMQSGSPLARQLPGRIGWELRLVVQGGLRILDRIEMAGYDIFNRRPVLKGGDWLSIICRCLM